MAGRIGSGSMPVEKDCICYIDCRVDASLANDFLNLSIWGKPVYEYAVDTVAGSGIFQDITVVTDSPKIRTSLRERRCISVQEEFSFPDNCPKVCIFSGRAAMVRPGTLRKAVSGFHGGMLCSAVRRNRIDARHPGRHCSFLGGHETVQTNAFAVYEITDKKMQEAPAGEFLTGPDEAVVINDANDFELVLVLKKKENSEKMRKKEILARIHEKAGILSSKAAVPSVCLVGHSQIDCWPVEELAGLKVKNCGIKGISSFEYSEYILDRGLLDCSSGIFAVMHGTNDIVLETEIGKMVSSIKKTVDYIRDRSPRGARVYFISCMHVNGRLDRDNRRIDELNARLKESLGSSAVWIDTAFMDNGCGELDVRNTSDGLHLSPHGYRVLGDCLENYIREDMGHGL